MKQTELKRKTQLKAKTPLQARVKLKQKSDLKQSKSRKCSSKRKKSKKTESIMHTKDGTCYLCMLLNDNNVRHEYTEEHHVFFGTAKRRLSEEHGLKVYLCMAHHTGSIKGNKMAVHPIKLICFFGQQDKEPLNRYIQDKSFRPYFKKTT